MNEETIVPAAGEGSRAPEAESASPTHPELSSSAPVSGKKRTLRRISLCRAFKERTRLAQRIAEIADLIREENSILVGGVRSIDIRRSFNAYMELSEKLIALRQTISRANEGITEKLVEMAEVKNILLRLRRIPPDEGPQSSYSKADVKVAEIGKAELNEIMESLREREHALQDEIDEFNARTYIEFEF